MLEGYYNKDDISNAIERINTTLNDMNRKAWYTGGWSGGFCRSEYADHQESITRLMETMKTIEKNETQQ